jgi:glycosyltransferase involved in cell wall biosynthesis
VGIRDSYTEVVVVDNASTDDTPAVLDDFSQRLPLRACFEGQQGHCFARNTAVAAASGQVILWTDDDVEPDPLWLARYRQVWEPEPVEDFWGGPIIPHFLSPAPLWLKRNWSRLAGCYAARDLGPEPLTLNADRLPYGANFAVRRSCCLQHPFDTQLGRKGQALMGEDERDFLLRLLAAGGTGRWVPEARLQHLIPGERLNLSYIADYFAGQAAVQWARNAAPDLDLDQLRAAIRHHTLWYQLTRWTCPSPVWLEHWIKLAMFRQWQRLRTSAPRR